MSRLPSPGPGEEEEGPSQAVFLFTTKLPTVDPTSRQEPVSQGPASSTLPSADRGLCSPGSLLPVTGVSPVAPRLGKLWASGCLGLR